jgi:hypothetical protein
MSRTNLSSAGRAVHDALSLWISDAFDTEELNGAIFLAALPKVNKFDARSVGSS